MVEKKELVSIIMPSFNTGNFIGQTIESVLKQTYKHWELIIVDDGSTDETDFVVAQYHDDRICYLKSDNNYGAAISRNRALKEARGKWIAFLDSDDLWFPEKLEKQINFMSSHGYAFSYTNYHIIDELGNDLGIKISGPPKITKTGLYNYCWLGCLTVMYNAEIIGIIQIEDIKKNNDYAMWLKVIKKADCFLFNEVLSSYRKRKGSISNQKYLKLIKWHYKLFRELDHKNCIEAVFLTLRNLVFGCWKKIRYVKRIVI